MFTLTRIGLGTLLSLPAFLLLLIPHTALACWNTYSEEEIDRKLSALEQTWCAKLDAGL